MIWQAVPNDARNVQLRLVDKLMKSECSKIESWGSFECQWLGIDQLFAYIVPMQSTGKEIKQSQLDPNLDL